MDIFIILMYVIAAAVGFTYSLVLLLAIFDIRKYLKRLLDLQMDERPFVPEGEPMNSDASALIRLAEEINGNKMSNTQT